MEPIKSEQGSKASRLSQCPSSAELNQLGGEPGA
jgi:hypothetical protein